ncbi:TRAM domain-containing protein [Candidatus Gottesmanbacteria bacterium]|nr:TRAM domain-containing protein [Candidatus Gottesmanbacteria bacterium]
MKKLSKDQVTSGQPTEKPVQKAGATALDALRPTAAFTQALAREIVKNLAALGQITTKPFRRGPKEGNGLTVQAGKKFKELGDNPVLVDTSVLIDGRILPIVNSGFFAGTMIIPQFVLREVQHIADSADSLRRAKGRRGLEVANKLKSQKVNPLVKTKTIDQDVADKPDVDSKLVALTRKWKEISEGRQARLLTVDFNLAGTARAQGVKVINVNDLAQALKVALMPGEELTLKITHEGREREQGVGYLSDGTMVVVDDAKDKVGSDVIVIVTKVHQTAAGQLFFSRLK